MYQIDFLGKLAKIFLNRFGYSAWEHSDMSIDRLIYFFPQWISINVLIIVSNVRLDVSLSNLPNRLKKQNQLQFNFIKLFYYFFSVYDASVKVPVGIEYGHVWQLGNFDECMTARTDFQVDGVNIEPQYCLADVVMEEYVVRHESTRQNRVSDKNF